MARPSFLSAWAASARIYDATNPGAKVAQVIGGNVAKNINNPDPKQRWENTCAVRMSCILNYSGLSSRAPSAKRSQARTNGGTTFVCRA